MAQAISVVIPAYNEEKGIGLVISGLREAFKSHLDSYEIIVVNDLSTDQTRERALEAGARVIGHPKNVGYGEALRTGILNAQYDWIATIDGDFSYPPGELLKLIPFTADFDMVIGARQGAHYWGNFIKHPARLFFLMLAQFVVGEKIPDVNSGMRIFKKAIAVKMLPRLCRGFSFSTTLTLSFLSSHCFVHFVPIEYSNRIGSSKVRFLRDTLRTVQLLWETIVFYNPTKATLLLVSFPLCGSLASLLGYAYQGHVLWLCSGLFLFCCSLLLMGLGMIAFILSQSGLQQMPQPPIQKPE